MKSFGSKREQHGTKDDEIPCGEENRQQKHKNNNCKNNSKKASHTKNTKSAPKRETTRMPESRERFGDSILDEVILIVIIVISAVVFISQITSKRGIVGQVIGGFSRDFWGSAAYFCRYWSSFTASGCLCQKSGNGLWCVPLAAPCSC